MKRVLVIDDSSTIRKVVELSMRKLTVACEFAQSGTEGLARAFANPPEVIFLDYLLPDMKGIEVCQALANDERTRGSVVVLLTGKDETVREQFRAFPQVQGYLRKPFTGSDLSAQLELASAVREAPLAVRASSASGLTHGLVSAGSSADAAPASAVAQALFSALKPQLALMPEWFRTLGQQKPAPFLARKLLTPEVVDAVARALTPLLTKNPAKVPPPDAFSGQLGRIPLMSVLQLVADQREVGVFECTTPARRTWVYLRQGAIQLVTCDVAADSLRGVHVDFAAIPVAPRERALEEQRVSGKPMLVSLAESGLVPAEQARSAVYEQGVRVMLELLEEPRPTFSWRQLQALPGWVDANAHELSLPQLQLERLRKVPAPVELGPGSEEWVYERAPGFSRRLRQFQLSEEERRVLSLVEGRYSIARLTRRSGLPPAQLSSIVHRLAVVQLIRRAETKVRSGRKVVLIDSVGGEELSSFLARRANPAELVVISPEHSELEYAIRRETPQLILFNASIASAQAQASLQTMMTSGELRVTTVAVLEDHDAKLPNKLLLSGFDHVLTKPIWLGDVDRLLES